MGGNRCSDSSEVIIFCVDYNDICVVRCRESAQKLKCPLWVVTLKVIIKDNQIALTQVFRLLTVDQVSTIVDVDLSALRRSGEEFPVELTISPIRIGDVYEFSAFLRDVSEQFDAAENIARAQRLATMNLAEDAAASRKQAERVEERLNLALQSARVGTWKTDVCTITCSIPGWRLKR